MTSKIIKCMVPTCVNTNVNAPNKHFFMIPRNDATRKVWLDAIRVNKFYSRFSTLHVCVDHFNLAEDAENFLRLKFFPDEKIRLKPTTVPRLFQGQPTKRHARLTNGNNSADETATIPEPSIIAAGNSDQNDVVPHSNTGISDPEDECITVRNPERVGRRVMNIAFIMDQLKALADHNSSICGLQHCDVVQEIRHGLKIEVTFQCRMCNYSTTIKSEKEGANVNLGIAGGTVSSKIGFRRAAEIFNRLKIPFMSENTYTKYEKKIQGESASGRRQPPVTKSPKIKQEATPSGSGPPRVRLRKSMEISEDYSSPFTEPLPSGQGRPRKCKISQNYSLRSRPQKRNRPPGRPRKRGRPRGSKSECKETDHSDVVIKNEPLDSDLMAMQIENGDMDRFDFGHHLETDSDHLTVIKTEPLGLGDYGDVSVKIEQVNEDELKQLAVRAESMDHTYSLLPDEENYRPPEAGESDHSDNSNVLWSDYDDDLSSVVPIKLIRLKSLREKIGSNRQPHKVTAFARFVDSHMKKMNNFEPHTRNEIRAKLLDKIENILLRNCHYDEPISPQTSPVTSSVFNDYGDG